MSNYGCPYCKEDLDSWFDKNEPCSVYGGVFNCPKCEEKIYCEYEEYYDGNEEYNHYYLKKHEGEIPNE